ncbi:BspA family leucine-rich repeat surface protein [Xylocopilactobacillus apis]|uniref:Surface protein n=1 Tax=Xylocopilactobacillus apis TaxID=2932183 RepID=A0AAU9CU00_9LACO|nr:BspA family leucine-rich repeat surface protein [Xylocopilactobacillus apis]BDR57457.1 hypothetical protein KIMC2_20190 [Xylocopilactobacillus apis]BDR57506.1 hypothetical protein KIMC2_20680 [Xylocopilactobacillus apis]
MNLSWRNFKYFFEVLIGILIFIVALSWHLDLKAEDRSAEVSVNKSQKLTRDDSSKIDGRVVRNGDFRFKASITTTNDQSVVSLNWDSIDGATDGYIVQKNKSERDLDLESAWSNLPTNYDKKVKILNVYPPGGNFLKTWLDQTDPQTGQPISKNLISVDAIDFSTFNADPNSYLKDAAGNYKYDGIYFGSSDTNGGTTPGVNDLTAASKSLVSDFGNTGRSLIFGHDTVTLTHPYLGSFAGNLGLEFGSSLPAGMTVTGLHFPSSSKVAFARKGSLISYPYQFTPEQILNIMPAHTSYQFYKYKSGALRWMQFSPPLSDLKTGTSMTNPDYLNDDSGNVVGDNNWYLVTKDNYAMIQTGHSTGSCTTDEAKIIANMIYYTSTLNMTTHGEDHEIDQDLTAPKAPYLASLNENNNNFRVNATDTGNDYFYRVKAKTATADKYSDMVKLTTAASGIKGYVYQIDSDPNGVAAPVKNAAGEVTNINLLPDVSGTSSATLNLTSITGTDQYLHIVAVDNNNNFDLSKSRTVKLNTTPWWTFQNGVLTIHPHQLNKTLDTSETVQDEDSWKWFPIWPWYSFRDEITKVVIEPGVSGIGDLSHLFYQLENVTEFVGITNLDTSQVTGIQSMFEWCKSISTVDFSGFDTRQVTDMSRVLRHCENVTSIRYGANFKTDNATDIGGFFESIKKMTTFDVSGFNTSNVEDMEDMFGGCDALISVDVSNFDTSKVKEMRFMFCNNASLKEVNLGNFNTSNLESMREMFVNDPALTKVTFGPDFKTDKVTNMMGLFRNCTSLPILDLSNFTINSGTNVDQMFANTPKLWQLTLGTDTKLSDLAGNDVGLVNPVRGTEINDETGKYYCTYSMWREVGVGTPHEPLGENKTAAQIVSDSKILSKTTTYVWDQLGSQRIRTTSDIDFGTHEGATRHHSYESTAQSLTVTDDRNGKSGNAWRIEAANSDMQNSSGKTISGNPLFYNDGSNEYNLTPVAQTIYSGTRSTNLEDSKTISWNLIFKAAAKDIPEAGHYSSTVTFTLVNVP